MKCALIYAQALSNSALDFLLFPVDFIFMLGRLLHQFLNIHCSQTISCSAVQRISNSDPCISDLVIPSEILSLERTSPMSDISFAW